MGQVERKCGSGTSAFYWAKSGIAEADFQILTDQVERKYGSGTSDIFTDQAEVKCGSGISDIHRASRAEVQKRTSDYERRRKRKWNFRSSWDRLSGSAEAELQIFTGQGKRNCGSGT